MKKLLCAAVVAGAMLMSSCGGTKSPITEGDKANLDTLSYAIGSQLGSMVKFQLRAIPINYEKAAEGLTDGAFDKGSMSNMEAFDLLQDFMTNKRGERMRAIMQQRKEADSIRLASGDSTRVEYPVADPAMFESEQERDEFAYAFGINMGHSLRDMDLPFQMYWVRQALLDSQEGNTPALDDRTAGMFWQKYMMQTLPEQNKQRSEEWLAEIEKQSGVKKTESGLLYKVVKMGDTTVMAKDVRDKVKVHYKGSKSNGKVFDASRFRDMPKMRQELLKKQMPEGYDKDEPIEFPLNRVIRGWSEGMQLVGKGGKIILWIPSDLAYGPRGNRGIYGNEALKFEVELIDVTPYLEPEAPKASPINPDTEVVVEEEDKE